MSTFSHLLRAQAFSLCFSPTSDFHSVAICIRNRHVVSRRSYNVMWGMRYIVMCCFVRQNFAEPAVNFLLSLRFKWLLSNSCSAIKCCAVFITDFVALGLLLLPASKFWLCMFKIKKVWGKATERVLLRSVCIIQSEREVTGSASQPFPNLKHQISGLKILRLHAVLHDAAGFVHDHSQMGPGYTYALPCPINSFYLGYASGIFFCYLFELNRLDTFSLLECLAKKSNVINALGVF